MISTCRNFSWITGGVMSPSSSGSAVIFGSTVFSGTAVPVTVTWQTASADRPFLSVAMIFTS